MNTKRSKIERKNTRKMVSEILDNTVSDSCLDIVNRYRYRAIVAWACFAAMIPLLVLAFLVRGQGMAYGTIKGMCVECGNPAMFTCHMCGAYLCNTHFQEGHVCKKTVAPMTLDVEEKVETGYKTKVEEPEIRRKKRY